MATVRTVNRLIRAVLSDILNIYHPGETISAEDALMMREAIQDRLAGWSDGGISIQAAVTEYFAMVSGTGSYTVGQSGTPTLTTVRPDQIIGAYVRQGDYDYPVAIYSEAQWRAITDKSSTGRPDKLYVLYSVPNLTLYLHPVPDSTDNFYFTSMKPYTEPTSYTQDAFADLGLPGVVYNALKWRLALDVAPAFRMQAPAEAKYNADDAYAKMTSLNLARNMQGAKIELAARGGRYTFSDFKGGF